MIPILIAALLLPHQLPHQVAKRAAPPAAAQTASAEMPQLRDAPHSDEYSSSQVTFFNGAADNGDGRVDVMHFQDGKTAITAGKDWRCSYVNDPVQHRIAIVCDAAPTK